MKKETLIDFGKWLNKKFNLTEKELDMLIDEYIESINEASNESLSVRDNEGKEKECRLKDDFRVDECEKLLDEDCKYCPWFI